MKYFHIHAKLLSPLMVQENRQSNAPEGLSYVPGSTLRGAIAAQYLRQGGQSTDAAFRMLFLEDPVYFPDLFPCNSPEQCPEPLPLTAYSCKRSPGFLGDNGHGVEDSLALLCAQNYEGSPLTKAIGCRKCGQDMKPFQGFWNAEVAHPQLCQPTMVYQRHTGIDRQTDTIASSIFYVTQGISDSRKKPDRADFSQRLEGQDPTESPQYLGGGIFLKDSQLEALQPCLQETIFAGADRTRGMGEMKLTLKESSPPKFNLEEWNRSFSKKVRELLNDSNKLPRGLYFSIGLLGHAILVDRFLRPTPELVLEHPSTELVLRIIREHIVRGWHSSRGLPKNDDTAVAMGGVYLFRYGGDDSEKLSNYLNQLVVQGVGLKKAEGFGRVTVCNPVHVTQGGF